jgi:hypothetical protein
MDREMSDHLNNLNASEQETNQETNSNLEQTDFLICPICLNVLEANHLQNHITQHEQENTPSVTSILSSVYSLPLLEPLHWMNATPTSSTLSASTAYNNNTVTSFSENVNSPRYSSDLSNLDNTTLYSSILQRDTSTTRPLHYSYTRVTLNSLNPLNTHNTPTTEDTPNTPHPQDTPNTSHTPYTPITPHTPNNPYTPNTPNTPNHQNTLNSPYSPYSRSIQNSQYNNTRPNLGISRLMQISQRLRNTHNGLPSLYSPFHHINTQLENLHPLSLGILDALSDSYDNYENNMYLAEHLGKVEVGIENIENVSTLINKKDAEDTMCTICLEQISQKEDDVPRKLICGHIYCNNCISQWLNKNKKCPVCNIDLEDKLNSI